MATPRERIINEFEGLIESTERTEKELEPLRLHVYRTELLKQQLVAFEFSKWTFTADERHDALARIIAETQEIMHEALALARTRGQVGSFRASVRANLMEAGKGFLSQIMAALDAVAEFLEVNNLTRTVAPPGEDVAETLWQECLEEHLEKYGDKPHALEVTKLRIFQDTVISVLLKAWQDRLRSLNDPISTLASTAAIYEGERQAGTARLQSLADELRG